MEFGSSGLISLLLFATAQRAILSFSHNQLGDKEFPSAAKKENVLCTQCEKGECLVYSMKGMACVPNISNSRMFSRLIRGYAS